jgi:hypothetical protein
MKDESASYELRFDCLGNSADYGRLIAIILAVFLFALALGVALSLRRWYKRQPLSK